MSQFYMELGGGLGDVFQQIIELEQYAALADLAPDDRARVAIISHNPFVAEIFAHHPRAAQLQVESLGYWLEDENERRRKEHGLSPWTQSPPVPRSEAPVVFYPSPADQVVTEIIAKHPSFQGWDRVVIFAPGAGLPERNLPRDVVLIAVCACADAGLLPVFVGRNYDRHGRDEEFASFEIGCVNVTDLLSVPGTAALVQRAGGLVCGHSALSMLSWLVGEQPQFLGYPPSVAARHFANKDQWSFGLERPECFPVEFGDLNAAAEALRRFVTLVLARAAVSLAMSAEELAVIPEEAL